ncbi:DHBP synthase RibB-like alpha/beta domain-containing protein [Radiomyces spectabilis]|uniref:DHBP synthase RibB-like alpha/beta domain-containing protein n=1 Tax=Radiomyces spectabilis TaxID=64574 RepID=UPI00221E9FE5|nr:DHBP synthase RibB-like alpha/beta domain-containing protein [Radiomyces spectabilis]KAI8380938.1 DHBP synthase RibB-like alpha/beta domain-containing protein [Radiomyces spectabilis]
MRPALLSSRRSLHFWPRVSVMNTKVLPVDITHFRFQAQPDDEFGVQNAKPVITKETDQTAILEAVRELKAGQAVGIPTETVYGLAANALQEDAVAKIFAAKNRPADNPLIVHVSSLDMLKTFMPDNTIPPVYLPIIKKLWPGPLTIILPSSPMIPSTVTCSQPTVAVRFPSHPVARALIDACGFPLAAPSANSSGKPSPTLASHVFHDLQGKIPLILDGGPCDVGVESTVLDALRTPPAILRPGGITYESLLSLPHMNKLQVYRKHFVDEALEQAPTTPGMKYRHYSPDAKVVLFEHSDKVSETTVHEVFETKWKSELAGFQKAGVTVRKVGVLQTTPEGEACHWEQVQSKDGVEYIEIQMGRRGHPEEVARGMFKGLRELDSRGVDLIFVQGIPELHEGMAVMNRLRKAASKIIDLGEL